MLVKGATDQIQSKNHVSVTTLTFDIVSYLNRGRVHYKQKIVF